MIAFDTNILTEILLGNPLFVARAGTIPARQQAVPVIVTAILSVFLDWQLSFGSKRKSDENVSRSKPDVSANA